MSRPLRELFVDRTRQMDAFRKMMDGQTQRRVMVLTAGTGMGKSWVLRTYEEQARARGLPVARIDFSDGQAYDTLTLVLKSRDLLGTQLFAALDQAILDAATPQINIDLQGAAAAPIDIDVSGATVAGSVNVNQGNITVSGNQFAINTNDPLIRRALEDRINRVFFRCLAELTAQSRVVFLFDSYEQLADDERNWASSPAHRWVVEELLRRIRTGELTQVVVVLAGRSAPEFEVEWNTLLGTIQLEPLTCDDVGVYLRERRGLGIITDTELARLCQAIGGNPSVLGLIGDNLEQANTPVADDEW
ncbi:MAG: AAA family ATPase [Roseiflexaceae bacterium]|nr:AAA family ATPase [Roseiflexaceae bacterium]